jgi:hypothetical protein
MNYKKIDSNVLELRMYGLVPYNISPIQQAIQFGHSVVEMSLFESNEDYVEWARYWKTFIILNGGTTNLNLESPGTLNQHFQTLLEKGIQFSYFHEPDLGDQLTAITFIVDERVFNKKKYPDFYDTLVNANSKEFIDTHILYVQEMVNDKRTVEEIFVPEYELWVESIGGKHNAFLKEWLKQFKLA